MEDEHEPAVERPAWQVFQWEDDDDEQPQLRYVGRIIKPEDELSSYWRPDAAIVGELFGEGRYIVFADEAILQWSNPSDYTREPIWLDVEAQTRYFERSTGTVR